MKHALQFRLSQHLALTPQLQQSIRLLQLSTLELQQEIEHALAENPLLEREHDWLESSLRIGTDGSINAQLPPGEAHSQLAANPQTTTSESPSESTEHETEYNDWALDGFTRQHHDDDDRDSPMQLSVAEVSLRDHLDEQLRTLPLGMRDRGLVRFLIESLDDDGYLSTPLEGLLAELPPELGIELNELHAALTLLRSFDPAGVGAQTASECLHLQLLRIQHPAQALALNIVDHHLELLAARDFSKLRKALKTDDDRLRLAHSLIRSLNPFPGQSFAQPAADYVVPDVIVKKTTRGWSVELNPDVMPRLRINDMYAQILRANRQDQTTNNLSQKLQEARWLIRNIQQRFETILRVSQAIVERQKNFFTHGEIAMKPLVLREIADTLGLHESTISRVTTNKYMATPLGTFELKYFFGSHVATETGGAASSTAIRALIKQMIAAEDTKRPLSDNQLAEMLSEQGFVVARRTVAKYREALKIQPVSLRKAL
jgi:RNA polymerase sigma-54 factor